MAQLSVVLATGTYSNPKKNKKPMDKAVGYKHDEVPWAPVPLRNKINPSNENIIYCI